MRRLSEFIRENGGWLFFLATIAVLYGSLD